MNTGTINPNADLIEQSYELLVPRAEELIENFYTTLFDRHPAVVPLFEHVDMRAQSAKLLAALDLVVNNVRNLGRISPALAELGKRHKDYGAERAHYEAVAATLVDVIAQMLGSQWNSELERSWFEALQSVSSLMLEGAERAQ